MLKIVNVSGGYSVASETTQPRRGETILQRKVKQLNPVGVKIL